jgi:hypothetical protein
MKRADVINGGALQHNNFVAELHTEEYCFRSQKWPEDLSGIRYPLVHLAPKTSLDRLMGHMKKVSGSALMSVPGRRLVTFDPMNAHSQAGEPPLCFVMEFNAAEREWQERLNRMLEDLENRLRMESPSRAAIKEQRHASQDPDTLTG